MRAEVEIDLTRGQESIKIDGQEISRYVCGLTLDAEAGRTPQLRLAIPIRNGVTATGAADPEVDLDIPPAVAELLIRAGWKAPYHYVAEGSDGD